MRVIETAIFKFNELGDSAKQVAIDNNRYTNIEDFDWYDGDFDDFKSIGDILGIEIDKILFSGFSAQGSGACFTGSYAYAPGCIKAIKSYAPTDAVLHGIAQDLLDIQAKGQFFGLTATITHNDRYCHENSVDIDVEHSKNDRWVGDEAERAIKEALKAFMQWMYRQLEKQHECLTSDDLVGAYLESNECEFTVDGMPISTLMQAA